MEDRGADFLVNDAIKDYIFDLHQATRFSCLRSEVDALYGAKFQELSKMYYGDKTAWPAPATIASMTPAPVGKGADEFFLCFYKEMADRHFFANGRPTAQDSVDAWANYCKLFDMVVANANGGAASPSHMVANEQWAFDVVHEFVYSFQGFAQYRADVSRRDPEDMAVLRAHPGAWSVQAVAEKLRALVKCSRVETVLSAAAAQGLSASQLDLDKPVPGSPDSNVQAPSKLHFDLGYFALVGLSRLECLLGDYHGCLACLGPHIDLAGDNEYYHKVFNCQVSLSYHCGLAYLMSRRYFDAIRTLGGIVGHVNRLSKTGALYSMGVDEQAAKKTAERCTSLLSIAVALTPGSSVEDVVHSLPKDAQRSFAESVASLEGASAADGASDLEAVFEKVCPKFVTGALPDYLNFKSAGGTSATSNHFEPVRRQVELFGKMASTQLALGKLRSFLKLYTAIEVDKLAKFQDATSDEVRSELLSSKLLASQVEGSKLEGSKSSTSSLKGALSGSIRSTLDVHFFVEDGLIHIEDFGDASGLIQHSHEHFFMAEIQRLDGVTAKVRAQARRFDDAKRNLADRAQGSKEYGGDDADDYD